MGYKTTDGLMRHLRENGVQINGSKQKRQLINTGYYHGYKGYRFFRESNKKLPFVSYDEIYATIQYDSKLKALLYEKMNIPWWRSHPIHENRATKSIWTEPCNPLLRATKSTKRATSA